VPFGKGDPAAQEGVHRSEAAPMHG
jgi:hypothetical protein